jgi:hypothetical protein
MFEKLYPYRFELFFISLLAILFGGIFFPLVIFDFILSPILYLINIFAGVILISKNKKVVMISIVLFVLVIIHYIIIHIFKATIEFFDLVKLGTYAIFYIVLTYELIKQVWQATIISKNVIIGVMSGYVCLGLIGFFMFITIEMFYPGSFSGIGSVHEVVENRDSLLYFSYITLLSIGFGEITPITLLARKATLLVGFLGQFYMVILTAIIVGKYIAQQEITTKK